MSLIALYKDELIADQMVVLSAPHAFGLTVRTTKTHMAPSKTFAFASVGPTLTDSEKAILAEILLDSFLQVGSEKDVIELTHQDWFETRTDLEILVMTKTTNYYSNFRAGEYQANRLARTRGVNSGTHSLIRFDASVPAVHGTGKYAAHVALLEGVKAKDVTKMVAEVEYTVSAEGSLIHRRELKRMVFK